MAILKSQVLTAMRAKAATTLPGGLGGATIPYSTQFPEITMLIDKLVADTGTTTFTDQLELDRYLAAGERQFRYGITV